MKRRTFLLSMAAAPARTVVEIRGREFWINGRPTYAGRRWNGYRIEGLLLNARLVQGIFDDANPATVQNWAYPDTGRWDPERNTREFIAAMPEWRRHGLLGFTINLQGGNPRGYSPDQPWENTAFRADGSLKPDYLARLERILNRADELGMAPILGLFYFGQDQRLNGDAAVRRGVQDATAWLLRKGWRNVMVEIANECDNRMYDQPLLKHDRIHELIELCRRASRGRLLIGASFNGGSIPRPNVVNASDFVLLHGNGVKEPARITQMVTQARNVDGYRGQPILFNEDDHFDFDKPECNFTAAVRAYAGWGYYDPDGYQRVPVNWGIHSERERGFFTKLKEITGQ